MKTAWMLGWLAALAAGSPEAARSADSSSSARPVAVGDARGAAKRTFKTPSGGTEACFVIKRFSDVGYSRRDRKKETALCAIDWNAAQTTADVTPAALAPKNNSTNPAVDVHQVNAAHSRESIESAEQAFRADRVGKKLGRFKQSLTAAFDKTQSYLPSILGYYQTSRLLGSAGEVAPAVLRTMEVSRHLEVAELGAQMPLRVSAVVKGMWAVYRDLDAGSRRDPRLYTSDGRQLYGALVAPTSGDEKDSAIETEPQLVSSERFRNLESDKPIAALLPGGTAAPFKDVVRTVVPMQGLAEMLILDAILLQPDRLSGANISFVRYSCFKKTDGAVECVPKDELSGEELARHPEATEVKKLFLNDVDAGLAFLTAEQMQAGREFALLKRISHVSPDLYLRVQRLAKLVADPAFETLAKAEWLFTDRDYVRYRKMAEVTAQLLRDRCAAGKLRLDLDVERHLAGRNFGQGQGCDVP